MVSWDILPDDLSYARLSLSLNLSPASITFSYVISFFPSFSRMFLVFHFIDEYILLFFYTFSSPFFIRLFRFLLSPFSSLFILLQLSLSPTFFLYSSITILFNDSFFRVLLILSSTLLPSFYPFFTPPFSFDVFFVFFSIPGVSSSHSPHSLPFTPLPYCSSHYSIAFISLLLLHFTLALSFSSFTSSPSVHPLLLHSNAVNPSPHSFPSTYPPRPVLLYSISLTPSPSLHQLHSPSLLSASTIRAGTIS